MLQLGERKKLKTLLWIVKFRTRFYNRGNVVLSKASLTEKRGTWAILQICLNWSLPVGSTFSSQARVNIQHRRRHNIAINLLRSHWLSGPGAQWRAYDLDETERTVRKTYLIKGRVGRCPKPIIGRCWRSRPEENCFSFSV